MAEPQTLIVDQGARGGQVENCRLDRGARPRWAMSLNEGGEGGLRLAASRRSAHDQVLTVEQRGDGDELHCCKIAMSPEEGRPGTWQPLHRPSGVRRHTIKPRLRS